MQPGKSAIVFLVIFFGMGIVLLEATIERVDSCAIQYRKDQPVPLIKGKTGFITLRGDLVDTATGFLAPPGIQISVLSRTGEGGTSTTLGISVMPGPNAAVGDHFIKLNYTLELGQPDIFMIRVKEIKINSITKVPAGDVAKGTPVTVTITGTGLADVRFTTSSIPHIFSNIQNITSTNTTYTFKAIAQASWSLAQAGYFRDTSITAESGTCNIIDFNPPLPFYKVGQADLSISKANVYRFLPQPEICAGTARIETQLRYCTDSPAPIANPTVASAQVEGVRNLGPIVYVVTNNSDFLISQPFKVQLKNGLKVMRSDVIDSLAARGIKTFSFSRPESRRKFMRHISCPGSCYDLDAAPFNWRDPVYTTVVDADNEVAESNEGNNNATSD